MSEKLPPLILKKREERRLFAGHLWVFSNEVDTGRTPLKAFEPGQLVDIQRNDGKTIGTGYVNPNSLICARLIARGGFRDFHSWLKEKLTDAISLREACYTDPYYRLCYSEGDFVPGLVVDRFGDHLVAQLNTAGMDAQRDAVVAVLKELLRPQSITLRNDTSSRELEGLRKEVVVVDGSEPDELWVHENGARFQIPAQSGQKTGWFFDHRHNRLRALNYVKGKKVLDLFSYFGGWGIEAAVAGAAHVTMVDASENAVAGCLANAAHNGVSERVRGLKGDVFDVIKSLHDAGERFDVVIADPPAFAKRKKDQQAGKEAYQRLNRLAMEITKPGGLLVSASCSFHMSAADLQAAIAKAAGQARRQVQIVETGSQGPDHPVHPAIPETSYLKAFFCRVL